MLSTAGSPARRAPLPALTGLRALAATWVVLFHFRTTFESLAPWLRVFDEIFRAGYLGVDLFFPLSGFVLAYNYADRLRAWSWRGSMAFWRNRVARVWPAHVVTLHIDLITSLALGRMGVTEGGHRRTLSAYLQNLVMVQNWSTDRPSFNGPAWSIASEWFAYLWAPVLFLATATLRRARSALLLAGLAYAAMLATYLAFGLPNGNVEHMFFVRIMGEFIGGMALCLAWIRGGRSLARFVWPAVLTVLACVWFLPATHSGHYWLAPLLGLAVAALAPSAGLFARLLSTPFMVAAGEASYCLYLTHYLLRDAVAALGHWGVVSAWRAGVALIALVVMFAAAAWTLHILVEVPARRLLRAR